MGSVSLLAWIGFVLFVMTLLALRLGVFHRKAHVVPLREAAIWSLVWVTLGLAFSVVVFHWMGSEAGLEYLTGYLIEKSLSMDNLFVFAMIFSHFAVPAQHQHRVLFWGIVPAMVMRGAMILAGAALLARFHWVIYVFGGFLVFTGLKMHFHHDREMRPKKNPVLSLFRRLAPTTSDYAGSRFFVRQGGKFRATPLLLVLITVETTDLVFAVDSISAVFAVTRDPFIIFTSNVFAILGLRAIYFLLAGCLGMFRHLKTGLSVVLCFVGVKMLLSDVAKAPVGISLGVIGFVLAVAILASAAANRRDAAAALAAAAAPGLPASEPDTAAKH